ncbi:FAD/NAD(P)-binding domain-containing protein [Pisolithus croceorrhizus]|nr:FAD/NAD(P)-binding domain-containing protein [Pisolithus croceorrhizus]
MASLDAVRRESVGIIGAGAAGLVTAHTLLQDGFENVQLLTRDKSVGGVWERQRIYPGLSLNNVHGEFCFSSLPMPPPQNQKRLGGEDMRAHMETFADTFLAGQIRFDEVLNIHRATGSGWEIEVQDLRTKVKQILAYDRIVLCTGGCSEPFIPESLSPDAAVKASFHGLVCHSAEFARHLDRILEDHKAIPDYSVLMVGGGKSAQDMSALSTRFGVKVTIVFEKTHAFLAYPIELPAILRKSRFLSIMASHIELRTRLERFLHTTWLGGKITRVFWDFLAWFSWQDNRNSTNPSTYPENSPLRSSHSLFWGILTNEEGVWKTDGFYALCNEGKIKLIAPARVVKYAGNGELVLLSNGTEIKVNAVLLATGFGSSWTNIFAQETAKELGIGRHPPLTDVEEHVWDYTSFSNPPTSHPRSEVWVSSIYRGIVPARNINHRDFAINGALSTTNNGYAFEVMAHWISSYFLGDKMRLPSSPEEATKLAGKNAAWMRRRFPGMPVCVNQSNNSEVAFWSCPQAMDDLLEDMGVPIMRSGGNWLTWPFKVITPAEIKNLREERRAKREMDLKAVN